MNAELNKWYNSLEVLPELIKYPSDRENEGDYQELLPFFVVSTKDGNCHVTARVSYTQGNVWEWQCVNINKEIFTIEDSEVLYWMAIVPPNDKFE